MILTCDQVASIADSERVWEVRRYYQVRHAINDSQVGDAALTALVKCLLHELDADLAALSLLDDLTQHFLTVVHSSTTHDPMLSRGDWFGCDQIPIRGGICERTITRDCFPKEYPIYEIFDLAADVTTKSLPIVNGTFASFGYYAGTPITTPAGLNIGALFFFKKNPQTQPLPRPQSIYLCETARQIMNHLTQMVGALDNTRSLRCNSASALFLSRAFPADESVNLTRSQVTPQVLDHAHASSWSHVFDSAADFILQSFDLDGVILQEVPRREISTALANPGNNRILAARSTTDGEILQPVDDTLARHLLEMFPTGAIFQLASTTDHGVFLASVQESATSRKTVRLQLRPQIPDAQQCIFIPLCDSFYDQQIAFIFGWTSTATRVYSSTTDLPSLATFGRAIMTQIRRLETNLINRKKADFVGSISHEMRSPLHGILACLEHMHDTGCSPEQLDLLRAAETCGLQLQTNIDNILEYSSIGPSTVATSWSSNKTVGTSQQQLGGTTDSETDECSLLSLVEDIVDRAGRGAYRAVSSNGFSESPEPRRSSIPHVGYPATYVTNSVKIVVDSSPESEVLMVQKTHLRIIVNRLLDNCIKFTNPGECVRVSLQLDVKTVTLIFVDAGRGMSADFLRHGLFVPFAQQDPLDKGVGLGLTLVQNAVQAVEGEISFETDTTIGTRVTVSLPRARVEVAKDVFFAVDKPSRTSILDNVVVPPKSIGLFLPTQRGDESLRSQRSRDSFTDSIKATMHAFLNLDLQLWKIGDIVPEMLFVPRADLETLKEAIQDLALPLQIIVICPHAQPASSITVPGSTGVATITEPLTPSKICTALRACCATSGTRSLTDEASVHSPSSSGKQNFPISVSSDTNLEPQVSIPLRESTIHSSTTIPSTEEQLSKGVADIKTTEPEVTDKEPKFLLVDDNPINLKVLAMYAKKCSKHPFALADSGQQAIDAYKSATSKEVSNTAFDIIMLDLSMPEISGFDVAAAIRELEGVQQDRPRTYIAALTGLVSLRDRTAAFEAGVDEYVTKPAKMKDLQAVIRNWRESFHA